MMDTHKTALDTRFVHAVTRLKLMETFHVNTQTHSMGTSKRTMSNHYKLFVPKDAATQTYHGVTSIQQKLQERFIDKFGGYTKTEATGGWENDHQTVEEPVIVYDIWTDIGGEAFIKANCQWLLRNTDECEVMCIINNDIHRVS